MFGPGHVPSPPVRRRQQWAARRLGKLRPDRARHRRCRSGHAAVGRRRRRLCGLRRNADGHAQSDLRWADPLGQQPGRPRLRRQTPANGLAQCHPPRHVDQRRRPRGRTAHEPIRQSGHGSRRGDPQRRHRAGNRHEPGALRRGTRPDDGHRLAPGPDAAEGRHQRQDSDRRRGAARKTGSACSAPTSDASSSAPTRPISRPCGSRGATSCTRSTTTRSAR